jgi:hypothetical protein
MTDQERNQPVGMTGWPRNPRAARGARGATRRQAGRPMAWAGGAGGRTGARASLLDSDLSRKLIDTPLQVIDKTVEYSG